MPVVLAQARAPFPGHDEWVALGPRPPLTPATPLRPGFAAELETAFEDSRDEVWALGKSLAGGNPSALLAHAPGGSPMVTDIGPMMAWTRLVRRWAVEARTTLVLCDDPWMFRHLASLPGVRAAGPAPAVWPRLLRGFLRGHAARARVAVAVIAAHFRTRHQRRHHEAGDTVLLVYGHPAADAEGRDGYFGFLMREIPPLKRLLHVDCGPARAGAIAADGRSASLHAWGSPWFALTLPFRRWRARPQDTTGPWGRLVRRAAARESATGQGARIAWQIHCQRRWLEASRPRTVAWPWENHGWERDFVRAANAAGAATAGYQHAVVGPHLLNYGVRSNPDGLASVPARVLCNGPATRDQLESWGVPAERLQVAGALRFTAGEAAPFDPAGPVFMAVPSELDVAREMLEAARAAAGRGFRFLVKDHPLTPCPFEESDGVRRTATPLARQKGIRAVVYAITTVGIEAVLMGLPTLRFVPAFRFAMNPFPVGVAAEAPAAGPDTFVDALLTLPKPPAVARARIFAEPDMALWRNILSGAGESARALPTEAA
jgi:hypothetical protein